VAHAARALNKTPAGLRRGAVEHAKGAFLLNLADKSLQTTRL